MFLFKLILICTAAFEILCTVQDHVHSGPGTTQSPASETTSTMSMEDMMKADIDELKKKYGDAFDKAFLLKMIPHHEGAVEMAKLALTHAKHIELKKMATNIIISQQREIQLMKRWLKKWGYV